MREKEIDREREREKEREAPRRISPFTTHTQRMHTHTHLRWGIYFALGHADKLGMYTHTHTHTHAFGYLFYTHTLRYIGVYTREVGGWGRDPKKCTGRGWGMGSSTI